MSLSKFVSIRVFGRKTASPLFLLTCYINIGSYGYKIMVKYIAFADDLAIIPKNKEEIRYAVERLHRIASNLDMSYEKTKFVESTLKSKKAQLEIEYETS